MLSSSGADRHTSFQSTSVPADIDYPLAQPAVSYTHLHCRHTTFGTVLDDVRIDDEAVRAAFEKYLAMRHELGRDEKPVCLMDMGTIGARWLKAKRCV